jgi:glycosyltransferase involved in cell wall biosynthesis
MITMKVLLLNPPAKERVVREGRYEYSAEIYDLVYSPLTLVNVGGLPEIFTHGENGLLVKPEDAEDLQEKIKILLTDENVKANIIQNSKKSLERFTWKSFMEKMESIYEKTPAH